MSDIITPYGQSRGRGFGSHLLHGGYRLYVEDGIRTERLKVDVATQNSWADFVFCKSSA